MPLYLRLRYALYTCKDIQRSLKTNALAGGGGGELSQRKDMSYPPYKFVITVITVSSYLLIRIPASKVNMRLVIFLSNLVLRAKYILKNNSYSFYYMYNDFMFSLNPNPNQFIMVSRNNILFFAIYGFTFLNISSSNSLLL